MVPLVPAHASTYGIELNGTFRAMSNGQWANTNETYRDEDVVVQTWKVTSSCTNPTECSGVVVSDQGWTRPIRFTNVRWILDRDVPNWEFCPDGTAVPGAQTLMFWGVDALGQLDVTNTDLMAGSDTTLGPSGACGVSRALRISMPMRVERIA